MSLKKFCPISWVFLTCPQKPYNLSEPLSALLGEATVSLPFMILMHDMLITHSFHDPKLSKRYGSISVKMSSKIPAIVAKSDAMMLCVLF